LNQSPSFPAFCARFFREHADSSKRWASVAALAAVTACGPVTGTDDAGQADQVEAKFSSIQQHVFVGCSTSSCHSPSGKAGNLDLTAANAYAQLVGHDTDISSPYGTQAKADGYLRVKANDPAKSFLLYKLSGHVDVKYGLSMPSIGDPVPAATLAKISEWVAAGALNN
jgi:hypothetical protein